ncbi:MAG: CotH kinase family protein [Flavobacteriales bacterium]|nr:CotH kinase family protein [Flavobacteriales bacterium]
MTGRSIGLALACWFPFGAWAQSDLYDPSVVHEVRIYFDEPDWQHILDSLMVAGNEERLIGDVRIDGTLLPDVGIRYKGYSSSASGRVKNPFNIKLDEVHDGQDHQGYDKLKLSNVIQDPSFLREILAYEIARQYMPASLTSFADVYVNDTLIGLYTNVQDVGKDFVKEHFGSKGGTFVKGNPAEVDLTGENSNLSDTPGTDSVAYYNLYELQSDHGWKDLLRLIDVLNNQPDSIESELNVDRALWMHAFNYAIINFDSYVGYAQNYYLYHDEWEQWNTIPWDLNMSFASFRLTDASTYWNGFTIPQAATMDPLSHHGSNPSVFPRPLLRNLFANGTWRRMYLAHLRTIISENIVSGSYRERALELRDLIQLHVLADTNKFYTDQAFLDNLDATVSFTIAYPGLTELMDQRAAYLAAYPGFSGQPAIGDPQHMPANVSVGAQLFITAAIASADTAFVAYRFNDQGLFERTAMFNDGLHGDGLAGDGVYGAAITMGSNLIEFYLYAENDSAGAFSPERAAYELHRILMPVAAGDVVINELMADNRGAVLDEDGYAADWIELYNRSGHALSTAGLFLSDDANDATKWALPTTQLDPGEYMIVWADGRANGGSRHANFKLDADGEAVVLAYDETTLIDQVTFGAQYPIYTTGRLPNGSGVFRRLTPTFYAYNRLSSEFDPDDDFQIFPNPASTQVFAIVDTDSEFDVGIFVPDGRLHAGPFTYGAGELVEIDTYGMKAGTYIMQVRTNGSTKRQEFIIIP